MDLQISLWCGVVSVSALFMISLSKYNVFTVILNNLGNSPLSLEWTLTTILLIESRKVQGYFLLNHSDEDFSGIIFFLYSVNNDNCLILILCFN